MKELKKLGWNVKPNKATFYMWLRTPPGVTSAEFAGHMLDTAGIVVPPGTAYGPGGEGYVRVSLCTTKERLQEAFDRIARSTRSLSIWAKPTYKRMLNAGIKSWCLHFFCKPADKNS